MKLFRNDRKTINRTSMRDLYKEYEKRMQPCPNCKKTPIIHIWRQEDKDYRIYCEIHCNCTRFKSSHSLIGAIDSHVEAVRKSITKNEANGIQNGMERHTIEYVIRKYEEEVAKKTAAVMKEADKDEKEF